MRAKQVSDERKLEILEILGDREQMAREMAEYHAAAVGFEENLPSYLASYPDQWIAVLDDEILADQDIEAVFEQLDQRGIPRHRAYMKFISTAQYARFI